MFEKTINNIKDKYNTKKKENETYNQLLQSTTTFQNLFPITTTNQEIQEHKITYITNNCPDINKEKATIITKLIPLEETFLTTLYGIEIKTNKEYYIIPTNKYLWMISQTNFGAYPYQNLNAQIIKNNLMSKTILFNNILLEINGTNDKLETFLNIINNQTERELIIKKETNYLQGIIPTYQKINSLFSGISLDNQLNIVFHNKDQNLRSTLTEITNYEILIDNQVYLSKNTENSTRMTNFFKNCYQISIRITTPNTTFIMPILEPNSFGTKYNFNDTILQNNLNFAKTIIEKLNNLTKSKY